MIEEEEEVECGDSRPIGRIHLRCGFDLQGECAYDIGRLTIYESGTFEVDVWDDDEEVWETRIYPSEVIRKVAFPEQEDYIGHFKVQESNNVTFWREGNEGFF